MDAEERAHFTAMTPEILAAVEQLERVVSPGVFDQVVRLTTLVDDHSGTRMQECLDGERDRVLAHFGEPWARLYGIVQAHIQHDALPSCTIYQRPRPGEFLPEEVCTLPPVDPWARTTQQPA
jgi:hypothetical protein